MAESTLTVTYPTLLRDLGRFLGYQDDSDVWTNDERRLIDACIEEGVLGFYFPGEFPEGTPDKIRSHRWSFLNCETTITLTAAETEQDLPDDFSSICGNLTYLPAVGWDPVKIATKQRINELRAENHADSHPELASVLPKLSAGREGQRWEICFWPLPDTSYVLTYRYRVVVNALSVRRPYPLGGAMYGNTLRAACLAAGERRLNKESSHYGKQFPVLLVQSIRRDQEASMPDTLGRMTDGSVRVRRVERISSGWTPPGY